MPNLSVSEAGTLFSTWYDETPRTAASCQPSNPANLCYQMHSRKSLDNGLTWLADETTSDVASPLPLQPDTSGTSELYAGDYDYGSAILTKHVTSWVDGATPSTAHRSRMPNEEPGGSTPTASPSRRRLRQLPDADSYSNGNALPDRLYDSYRHWHDNPGRHRYRQPLRRLQHGYQSTLPGKRLGNPPISVGVCRNGRRPYSSSPPAPKASW